MSRSTRLIIPAIPFGLAAIFTHGTTLYVVAAIAIVSAVAGGIFWIFDSE